ncbi:Alpha/Beta hydrolase protein [Cubamyces menziesii]|nr:Alpha/Beta hydrolase protein [Cubamyces menziesii]
MDPQYAAALTKAGLLGSAPPPPPSTAKEARAGFDIAVLKGYKAFLEPNLPPSNTYTVTDYPVSVEGGEISVRCLVPVADDQGVTFPVLVNIHGGGWTLGSVELDDYALRGYCVRQKISIVNVEYRLAPEYPFPTAVDDCHAALKWVVSNASLLKADVKKGFLIGGESAGANLSAVLAHIIRDDPSFEGRRLTGQLLCEPNVCHYAAYPESLQSQFRSMDEIPDMPALTRATIERFYEWYNAPPSDPRFSPLLYPSHQGLPRAYIQAMGLDALRDDALVYAEVLREAGVETKLDIYPGVGHGFQYGVPDIPAAAKVRADTEQAIGWLLNRESPA